MKKMSFMIFSHKVTLDTTSDRGQDHWGLYNISTVSILSSNFASLFIAFLLHSDSSQQYHLGSFENISKKLQAKAPKR